MSLFKHSNKFATSVILALTMASCSSSPKTYAPNAEASPEIDAAEKNLQAAADSQVNLFAPETFTNAEKELNQAKRDRADNKSNEEILKHVEKSNAILESANKKAEIAKVALPGVAEAREAAIKVGADQNHARNFKAADKDLMNFTEDSERGRLDHPERATKKLLTQYRNLEIDGTVSTKLGKAESAINEARKEGAKEFAPKSHAIAMTYYNNALAAIKANPTNFDAIDPAADRATYEAEKLLRVVRKTKAAGGAKAEDVVLKSESQEEYIYKQKEELADAQSERREIQSEAARLRGIENMQDKVAAIGSKFDPKEAEVYQQDHSVIIRLKGVKFGKGKAEIPSSSFATLKKLEEAIESFDHPKVKIQGHTDATGTSKINLPLSKKRAESVKNYLTANLDLKEDVDVKGFGSTRPITTNKTAEGRAENRRIDVVIDTSGRTQDEQAR
jgi:OOP family OmpA-OmpF porin